MARTALPITEIPGFAAVESVDLVWTRATAPDGNSYVLTGREIVLVRNLSDDTGSFVTVVAAGQGRDYSESIQPGMHRILPLLTPSRYGQADHTVYIDSETDDLEFVVLRLPT